MKKSLFYSIPILLFTGCSTAYNNPVNNNQLYLSSSTITDDGTTTNYADKTKAPASAVFEEDLYENFNADGIVYIDFDKNAVTAHLEGTEQVTITATETSLGKIADTKVTAALSANTLEDAANEIDEASDGIVIQYKGTGKIKYILSGTYEGTVFIKNKKADAAVILNNANITSSNGAGPVLRFSSELRTFIVVPEGTTNTLTDSRILNQSATMYDDKKGSVYSKGTLIFTGESANQTTGELSIINSGYKHAVYSKDYVRIADGINLNINVSGTNGRDCIRALNAVIIDGGNINLTGKGTIEDDESNGIRVDGEDADEDDMTVEYTAGAGFIIINGGKLTINTIAKGITAHWKSAKSVINDSEYTAIANNSLLCTSYLAETSATKPNPFVEINGGIINITTTGEPYEGRTDDDPSCSPEGIEAKGNLTINAGTITLQCTDDALNAGGNITINGGALYACSSKNDAIDSNGSSGITINDGVIVAIGINTPECAFDCDQNPLTINGGLLVGLGTNNYTAPENGKQTTGVLASSNYGNANTTMAIVDSNNTPVFVYTLPSSAGEVMILSSPAIKANTNYTVMKNVCVSGGTRFHNLYTTLPEISGGSSTITNFATTSSKSVYTDSSVTNGFRDGPDDFNRTRR